MTKYELDYDPKILKMAEAIYGVQTKMYSFYIPWNEISVFRKNNYYKMAEAAYFAIDASMI